MKAVILAGGYGSRLSEETKTIPKPMVEIGGKPIIWHIMKTYEHYGITEFVVCCGYKQYAIKEYFANYFQHNCDMTVDLSNNSVQIHQNKSEKWKVTMVDTGLNTMTGGRIKQIQPYIGESRFCLTYGDGVSDVDITDTIRVHERNKALLTLTAYLPTGKFGSLSIDEESGAVKSFSEKPKENDNHWINAGYFVCEPEVFDFIPENDVSCVFEKEPLEKIARTGRMHAYKHTGFWKPMDMLKDNKELNEMWNQGKAPWKVW